MKPLLLGYDAREKPVHLQPEDAGIHTHVIGASGSGKSKLLESIMRQHLVRRQGYALIDPHGQLYEDVLAFAAHRALNRDIILLNLSRPDASLIGFNPFRRAPAGDISVQVDRRVTATMHAWGAENTDQLPTLARTLRLVYTVMLECNLGLPQVQHLIDFNARDIRAHLINKLGSELVQREWRELQALKAKEWRDETLSAKNRLFKFLTSDTLCRFMGLPGRSLDLRQVMDEGRVVLVNLAPSDYLSHENARAFGALLVNEFFENALRRERDEFGRPPKPYHLILDEFQSFVSVDIADMLDQVRKFGLFLTLAHQRFGQLDPNIIDAVLTNCRIKAVFGGLPYESAKLMAQELFIRELDPKKIKVAIYQTKFWPEYRRDKVYSRSSSRGGSSGHSESQSSGSSTGMSTGVSSGMSHEASYFMPDQWFAMTNGFTRSEMTSSATSSMSSYSSGSGTSESESWSDSEGEADIPIFFPVPFQELSSVQYYSLEEQLTELTAALKEQFPRHCFIKIQGQQTQPLLVPFVAGVTSFRDSTKNLEWYCGWQLEKHQALPIPEIDRLLASQNSALLQAIAAPTQTIDIRPGNQEEPPEDGDAQVPVAVEPKPQPKPAASARKAPSPWTRTLSK